MADELVLDIKTNIGEATKETKEYKKSLEQVNEEINLQNKFIIAQEKELLKLKRQQDAMPKSGWSAGMDNLNDKIRETTAELKDEKNALKSLKQEQKEAKEEIKKSTAAQKENNKESEDAIGNFKVMGVSLNGIKKGFSQIIPIAKAMFGTIKAGIMSTGIGALVLAVIALTQAFKRSEAGQDKFQRIMAGIGAVTGEVLDLFSDLGETIIEAVTKPQDALKKLGKNIVDFFKDPIGAAKNLINTVEEFVEKTKEEVAAIDEITKARQKAHKIDRELKVERAKANKEINDIRLQAEDREKFNATERIALLRKAQKIEEDITLKEIESKQLLVDAQIKEMEITKSTKEDKDKLAQLQAELINLDTKKLRSQRLLQTQITTAINEEKALRGEALKGIILMDNTFEQSIKKRIELISELNKAEDFSFEKKKTIELSLQELSEKRIEFDAMTQNEKLNLSKKTLSDLSKIAGEESKTGKALAITATTIDTFQSAQASYKSLSGIPVIGPALGGIAAAAAVAMGMKNIAAIRGANSSGGVGGGGNISAPNTSTPAPQMMSGSFDLSGGVAPDPVEAFVITDKMTSSQNQLANIRRRATI